MDNRFLITGALLLPMLGFNLNAVEIIAHRGASADAPENTLSSMRLAWKQNADAIETDMWLSTDGKIIVFHDDLTKRYDGKARKISSLSWEESQQVDVGSWKGTQFKGERMPSLESLLGTVPKGRRAVLEIKCGPEIVPELSRVIRGSGRTTSEVAIISFNYEALKESKRVLPHLEHYFLSGYDKNKQTGELPQLGPLLARCKEAHFDGLDLQFKWPMTPAFVSQVKAAGMKLVVWTVDDPIVARRLTEAGVDGITTNKPEWLREQLK